MQARPPHLDLVFCAPHMMVYLMCKTSVLHIWRCAARENQCTPYMEMCTLCSSHEGGAQIRRMCSTRTLHGFRSPHHVRRTPCIASLRTLFGLLWWAAAAMTCSPPAPGRYLRMHNMCTMCVQCVYDVCRVCVRCAHANRPWRKGWPMPLHNWVMHTM